MIWDSEPWRDHLRAEARSLAKRSKTKRRTQRTSVLIERAVFFGAYSMRKLDEAKKLSASWQGSVIKCTSYAPTTGRRPPSLLDWHHIDRHYDLSKPKPDVMSAHNFCDLVVHSFIFVEHLHEDRTVDGFYITSDKKKANGLWLFGIDAVIGLMERTAQDSPPVVVTVLDPETGEAKVWAGDQEPPEGWRRIIDRQLMRHRVGNAGDK